MLALAACVAPILLLLLVWYMFIVCSFCFGGPQTSECCVSTLSSYAPPRRRYCFSVDVTLEAYLEREAYSA